MLNVLAVEVPSSSAEESDDSSLVSELDVSPMLYEPEAKIACTVIAPSTAHSAHTMRGVFNDVIILHRHGALTVNNISWGWFDVESWGVRLSGAPAPINMLQGHNDNVPVQIIFEASLVHGVIYKGVANWRRGAATHIMLTGTADARGGRQSYQPICNQPTIQSANQLISQSAHLPTDEMHGFRKRRRRGTASRGATVSSAQGHDHVQDP